MVMMVGREGISLGQIPPPLQSLKKAVKRRRVGWTGMSWKRRPRKVRLEEKMYWGGSCLACMCFIWQAGPPPPLLGWVKIRFIGGAHAYHCADGLITG